MAGQTRQPETCQAHCADCLRSAARVGAAMQLGNGAESFGVVQVYSQRSSQYRHGGVHAASTVKSERRDRGERTVQAGIDFPFKEEVAAAITMMDGRWRPLILVLAFCG